MSAVRTAVEANVADGCLLLPDSGQPGVSTAGGPDEECRCSATPETKGHSLRGTCSAPECSPDGEIDLESGELGVEGGTEEKHCRICHLSLSGSCGTGGGGGANCEPSASGSAIELGCSCKGDLGTVHKQCAETWFKIKGNTWICLCYILSSCTTVMVQCIRPNNYMFIESFHSCRLDFRITVQQSPNNGKEICEICGANAHNVAREQVIVDHEENNGVTVALRAPVIYHETQSVWHGRRVMNFFLFCMIFAFVISWLFHFNILP